MNHKKVRVRFAPSPTGKLHLGNVRAGIFNWLFARHHGGDFLVRLEDTDRERSTKEFEENILTTLNWLGMSSDEPIVHQSKNLPRHKEIADQLLSLGLAYRCYCSAEKIEKLREDFSGDAFVYPRICRDLAQVEDERPFVVRFKAGLSENLSFEDLVKGRLDLQADKIDDFVLLRQDGNPTYNLAVVVDDFDMKITHVIRGEDHIINSYKQIMIYKALGWSIPKFAHLPMILGSGGARLSKRYGAVAASDFCKDGFLPDALINYLARLGWSHGDQEFFSKNELVKLFSLDAVNKSNSSFDLAKLKWINSEHLKILSSHEVLELARHANADLVQSVEELAESYGQLESLIRVYQKRSETLIELFDQIKLVLNHFFQGGLQDSCSSLSPDARLVVKDFFSFIITSKADKDPDKCQAAVKSFLAEKGLKFPQLAKPIRLVLTGRETGPSISELIPAFDIAKMTSLF